MTPIAYDYSDGPIAPASLLAEGVRLVMRYVSTPGNSKNITAGEYGQLVRAGIAVGLNYETSANWMLGGYDAGVAAARSARAQATAVGYPSWYPIWYSADFQAPADQIATILDTLHGCADAEGSKALAQVYGDYAVIEAAVAAGFTRPWQTRAWSGSSRSSSAWLYQTGDQTVVDGVQVDVNDVVDDPFPTTSPAAAAAPQEETEMLIIDAPRSAAANAPRDMWLLANGRYRHIISQAAYQGYVKAGLKVVVVEYADHEDYLTAYGAAGIPA